MRIGSIWESIDKEFKVNDIKTVDGNTWIFYNNVSTRQDYSCLKEAFLQRFREKVNNG